MVHNTHLPFNETRAGREMHQPQTTRCGQYSHLSAYCRLWFPLTRRHAFVSRIIILYHTYYTLYYAPLLFKLALGDAATIFEDASIFLHTKKATNWPIRLQYFVDAHKEFVIIS